VDAYRTGEPHEARVAYGRRRRSVLALLLGIALVAAALGGFYLLFDRTSEARSGSSILVTARMALLLLLPLGLGVSLSMGPTGGFVEIAQDGLVLTVRRVRPWPWRTTVQARELAAVDVSLIASGDKGATYELRLFLRDGRKLALIQAASDGELEADRVAVADFVRARGLDVVSEPARRAVTGSRA
jgi:hypothetical protein